MVTAVTLNPCVDHTLMVSRLIAGGHHETVRTHEDISGKGINVNKVLHQLGVETGAVGFDYTGSSSRYGKNQYPVLPKMKVFLIMRFVNGASI